jgi:rhodanese-related sulfurtransferase
VISQISVQELESKLASGAPVYLIDVRQAWEHATVALPNSVWIPLDELLAGRDDIRPPAGALVVAYCHHGIRSLSAAGLLHRLGIRPVASLAGGIDAWAREIDPRVPRY